MSLLDDNISIVIDGIRQGKYSLLLGSGISTSSKDTNGFSLPTGNALREEICNLYKLPLSTSLSRAYKVLKEDDIEKLLTKRFSNTSPSKELVTLSSYFWKRIYTFNIDDAIENAYAKNTSRMQDLIICNYNDSFYFSDNKEKLQIVHLHGYSKKPKDNYVFSTNEYVSSMQNNNAWMHVLTEIIATEAFIISGLSFDEPDFEFYSNYRNRNTTRRDMAPSLLIEPFPSELTRIECNESL